jgi:hypothetical protein
MPTQPCPNEPIGSQIVAQTLFLGASVNSFNTSMGWGGQPSQLTVTLIEDSAISGCLALGPQSTTGSASIEGATIAAQLPVNADEDGTLKASIDSDRFSLDHYHTCVGDNCYVNSKGTPFNRTTMSMSERMVPGKVYYEFTDSGGGLAADSETNLNKCVKSKYWYNPDPGFFGQPNRINPDNTYNKIWNTNNTNLNKGYDIIDTPVFFKMGNFSFGGLVQSWTRQVGQGGKVYTVTVNSMQALLNSCHIIIGNYAGAIYSKLAGSSPQAGNVYTNNSLYGGPRNYTGHSGVDYFGRIYEGNIPNVFNVYGFLESFGLDGLGGAGSTTEGISANLIVDALSVLTSTTNFGHNLRFRLSEPSFEAYGERVAFSPFGRILAKCMQENDTYIPIDPLFRRFGVIPPTTVDQENPSVRGGQSKRCQFLLDLSEIPRLPQDFRISGPVITITDLLNTIADHAGFDYYVDLVPLSAGGKFYNVIKVKTISRLAQPRQNEIENTIKNFQCNNYPISSETIGKEKNDTSARAMIIGGPIQRLYQAKSLRLAYTQSNYIFNPGTKEFIDYMQLGRVNQSFARTIAAGITRQFHYGKIRPPSALNNHNPVLSSIINPTYQGVYTHNDEIKQRIPNINFDFDDIDPEWNDGAELGNGMNGKAAGNYGKAQILKVEAPDQSTWGLTLPQRFFPLFKDVICPFFGFVLENEQDIKFDGSNNDFRRVRPVWFDTWTGQLVVLLRIPELPATSVNLENSYAIGTMQYFLVTESEIRAALSGFDEFLVYSLSKTYKNDLVEMLRRAYIAKDALKYTAEGLSSSDALIAAQNKHNWYWKLMGGSAGVAGGNIAGPFTQTIVPAPDRIDGTHHIDQNAIQDLKILHNFVAELGKYYGKKYMVVAPYLAGYRDNSFADIILPTAAGTSYVFAGGGDLHYSYTPTNDGAWEEYGNIIDDCIAVGGKEWYNLTDDTGKIKPLLGYNANDQIDYAKQYMCLMSQQQLDSFNYDRTNPYWSFEAWDILRDRRGTACTNNEFIFPGLDYASLSPSDYVMVSVSGIGGNAPPLHNQLSVVPRPSADARRQAAEAFINGLSYSWFQTNGKDAFGQSTTLPIKKLFVTTSVDESFVFLDPENLKEPRILVDAPGLFLNNSSDQYAKDPNKTILANVAMEDLAIYLKSTTDGQRDQGWINYMLSHISTVLDNTGFTLGNYGSSANNSAAHAMMSPKAAHPFFVGIPLKSNIYNYGPWTNYPYLEYLSNPTGVFPSGFTITQSNEIPPVCTTGVVNINADQASLAVDNWILSTSVDLKEDYVPWNYGGMAFLDSVAANDARSRTNYQNVIETAQVDIPGTPLFNLGGTFSYGNFGVIPTGVMCTGIGFIDSKFNLSNPLLGIPPSPLPTIFEPMIPPTTEREIIYQILTIKSQPNNLGGPVITNIQTNANQAGITSTYSFRTYTRKLGFFNKENSDRVKRMHLDGIRRNKQFAQLAQQTINYTNKQLRSIQQQRLDGGAGISGKDFKSKLFGWSPVKVLIGQSYPYLGQLDRTPYIHSGIFYSSTGVSTKSDTVSNFRIKFGNDPGDDSKTWAGGEGSTNSGLYLSDNTTIPALSLATRYRTDVGIFEDKEVNAQIHQDYGLQGMMSLDGIFSPVSFYPTFKNSTFSMGLHDTSLCPFCNGTKRISVSYQKYTNTGYGGFGIYSIYCDKCTSKENKLNLKLKSNITSSSTRSSEVLPPYIVTSGTDLNALLEYGINPESSNISSSNSSNDSSGRAGVSIPINMVSLQPIVVPYGEFKNPNVQNYVGVHPEGVHEDLSINAFGSSTPRTFYDRCRHSIEVVGRGAVNPTNINIVNGLKDYHETQKGSTIFVNADYYDKDIKLARQVKDRTGGNINVANNQRFMGLRGPLVLHAWGYDLEGYPVPNAADEPYEFDTFGRPKRFKVKIKSGYPKTVTFKDLKVGALFKINQFLNTGIKEYAKEKEIDDSETITLDPNVTVQNSTNVSEIAYEDDLNHVGGFMTDGTTSLSDRTVDFQGSIISKTQKWDGSKWSEKKKLKEFYLNWAERTDLWPVGPIDLRWDESRKVWATKSDSGASIYKMVYVTLEEDLYKEPEEDETYPARAFLDEIEYSNEPLPNGFRRLVFVKDKGGYTAPRGAKLLCRYSTDTGFYEPITKQSFVVTGLLAANNTATIELSYIVGRKRGEPVPTMLVNIDNPFDFNITVGHKGLFTFMNGKWTLTATKET